MQGKEKFKFWTKNETEAAMAGGVLGLGGTYLVAGLDLGTARLNNYIEIPKPEIHAEDPEMGVVAVGIILGTIALTAIQMGFRRLAYRDRQKETARGFDKTREQIQNLPEINKET